MKEIKIEKMLIAMLLVFLGLLVIAAMTQVNIVSNFALDVPAMSFTTDTIFGGKGW